MATLKSTQVVWNTEEHTFNTFSLWKKYIRYADGQQSNHLAWWLVSLLVHATLLVPLTFLLVYTSNGPAMLFLAVSMISFFINIVANMGGASTRFTIMAFWVSVFLHAFMVLSTLIMF